MFVKNTIFDYNKFPDYKELQAKTRSRKIERAEIKSLFSCEIQ